MSDRLWDFEYVEIFSSMPEAYKPSLSEDRIKELERRMGIKHWVNRNILLHALTHPSFIFDEGKSPFVELGANPWQYSNETFEYFGDAILKYLACEGTFHEMPGANEGELTQRSDPLVTNKRFAALAKKIGLEEFLFIGKSLQVAFTQRDDFRSKILSNAFEALVGGLHLDQGLCVVQIFLDHVFWPSDNGRPANGMNRRFTDLHE